ncbi:pesticidal protein Cry26Aa [Nocardiopsis sp. HNM0947]|uniref:Pesticidal protein Cry26Aa n=1 Tax=Nocardiopsis coralli TaxID=2772213 RepID=A0ABR9P3H8_9ACTN|nr:monovalent cation/H+ antiporter complex subunit F [Nocardiopsis coralli]MBE2998378.1 pesticidal protein Cry26Aa [Nocardiopsis coralli]
MSIIDIALAAIVASMIIATYRIMRGPSGADRGSGSDMIFFGFVGLVAILGVRLETALLVDIVVVCTLVGFLAAISLARLTAGGKR